MKNFLKKTYWKIKFWVKLLVLSPGVVVHELAHAFFCVLTGVKIFKLKLFQFSEVAGYVEHEQAKSLISAFLISFGPLFLNTAIAFFLFEQITFLKNLPSISWKNLLFFYLAISIALSAIPSDQDGKSFGNYIKKRVKKNFLFFPIFIFYPFVWILNVLNYLKKFKFDYFFAVMIFYFAIFLW